MLNTRQKNLMVGLLKYWTEFYNTTLGENITWGMPVKKTIDGEDEWEIVVFEKDNGCNTSNDFDFIAKITGACGASCYMRKCSTSGYEFHIF